ncbi:hypothetical protein LRS11_18035 [Pseudomonas sp. J452]|uniref:hypothetical protein n=1 Tax=Pseudomonas sp. J452 TaxID=2898441 RepID=UPI0021ADCF28|nr:hypothetical protein [Pseudomonas sp. J452]UUY07700.1 hypothetical protein LRS11_18035 [Pseudomonas sp. J452]
MDVFGGRDYYERLLRVTQEGELIDLGEVVTCLREGVTEWSREVFARACKIPLETLEGIENGTSELSVDHVNAILMLFGLQVGIAPYRPGEFATLPQRVKSRREQIFTFKTPPQAPQETVHEEINVGQ